MLSFAVRHIGTEAAVSPIYTTTSKVNSEKKKTQNIFIPHVCV